MHLTNNRCINLLYINILFGFSIFLLSGCNNDQDQQVDLNEPILIKFPHVTTPTTPKGQAINRFKQLVEERLAGRVVVEVYPSSQLMNDDDSLDSLASGKIQMIAISLSKLDHLTKKFQLFDLPFLFKDIEAVETFQSSENGKDMLNTVSDHGITGLSFWHEGMKQFGGPVPLRTPEDAEGLKFQIMESDLQQVKFEVLRGIPQNFAPGEVYQALLSGVLDIQENTWSDIYSSKYFEAQPYLVNSNHSYLGYLIATNNKFWQSLPDDIRSELELIVQEVSEWVNQLSLDINLKARDRIASFGSSKVIELTNAQHRQWQNKMSEVWVQFEDQIGADNIRKAQLMSK